LLVCTGAQIRFHGVRSSETTLGGFPLFMIGLDDPIAAKEAAGRPRDLVAVEELKKRRDELARRPKEAG
jgi:hypothetical protein